MNDRQREACVTYANYLIHHASQIHYRQFRPMQTRNLTVMEARALFAHGGGIAMDCSESTTLLCRWAGVGDPNGMGYDGWGNSGSQWTHCKPHYFDPAKAHPGALVTFGTDGDEHVCMVIERNGDNPILFSHGQEAGPLRIDLNSETRGHLGQARTFLDVSHL